MQNLISHLILSISFTNFAAKLANCPKVYPSPKTKNFSCTWIHSRLFANIYVSVYLIFSRRLYLFLRSSWDSTRCSWLWVNLLVLVYFDLCVLELSIPFSWFCWAGSFNWRRVWSLRVVEGVLEVVSLFFLSISNYNKGLYLKWLNLHKTQVFLRVFNQYQRITTDKISDKIDWLTILIFSKIDFGALKIATCVS